MVSGKFYHGIIKRWKMDTFGYIAIASFLIVVLSGILLAVSYDVQNPEKSISLLLLTNPAATFFRNIHYWSAQLFLVFSFLHIWEYFVKGTEIKINLGVWLRLTAGIIFILFVMISGFILKGDADSVQAHRIINGLILKIPVIGRVISAGLIGDSGNYQLMYVHHIATATLFLFIIIFEHSKVIWAKAYTFFVTMMIVIFLSLLITPLPKTSFDSLIRGPWYFIGLQEILHYLSEPSTAVFISILFIILFAYMPKFGIGIRDKIKSVFTVLSIAYLFLSVFVFFSRGENWELNYSGYSELTDGFQLSLINPFAFPPDSAISNALVQERYEGCLNCHYNFEGFSAAHSTEALGCYSCHRGNPFTLNKSDAHNGMILIPGNLNVSKITCGNTSCHPGIHERVENSIMNRLTGMIAVNRFVFDESELPDDSVTVFQLTDSPADRHLRQLCVSCHIGKQKTEFGRITQESRGGGCLACHLNYSDEAADELKNPVEQRILHPSMDLNISDDHCFGCHSRSGRISLNYTGYNETQKNAEELDDTINYKLLTDGRVVEKIIPDVHYEMGMSCIDCHISYEIMGDGNKYIHKEEQLKIKCEDCHNKEPKTIGYSDLSEEERKIFDMRGFRKFGDTLLAAESGYAFINSFVENDSKFLITKLGNKRLPLKEPASICTDGKAHENVSCSACHTSWAPKCIGCHTEYFPDEKSFDHLTGKEVEGSWVEFVGDFTAEAPVMGVLEKNGKKEVIPVVPGMVLTIDKKNDSDQIFKRLFAPSVPHTIVKKGRNCQSCHLNSLALGYGKGVLNIQLKGKTAEIKFLADYEKREEDKLPEDAWIAPLSNQFESKSTRTNVRALNEEEQKNILTVGLCLNCHQEDKSFFKLFSSWKGNNRISPKCITSFSFKQF